MSSAGYHGHPIVKPPVWTWEVPLYLFVGGTSGMSAVVAVSSLVGSAPLGLARSALWIALVGSLLSPVLLILDLGRPRRFLNMLRVFKLRSAMSVGAWTLVVFGGAAFASVFLFETFPLWVEELGLPAELMSALLYSAMLAAAVSGALLATYTGVLLAATAIPVWAAHRTLLPVHFAAAGLGGAVALIELFGPEAPALATIAVVVSSIETLILLLTELKPGGVRARVLQTGRAALLLRSGGLLMGPVPLGLRMIGAWPLAALSFLAGALLSRYGWVAAGKASAADPEAVLAR